MNNQSIYERQFDPIVQAAAVLGAVLIIDLVGAAIGGGPVDRPNLFAWQCASAFMLFFALFNSIFAATTKNIGRYFQRSMYAFTAIAVGSGLLAWIFSGIPITEAGSYTWIFIVLTIGYFVFMGIVLVMRKVVDFAQKEEWNRPRPRNRRRK